MIRATHIPAGIACALALLIGAAPANAASYAIEQIQHTLDDAGNPVLSAVTNSDDSKQRLDWSICRTPTTCEPIADTDGDPFSFAPGDTPAGTAFKVKATEGKATASATSRTWRGHVTLFASPTFSAAPKIDARLQPTGGIWSGGWDYDYSMVGVEACRNADATACETVWRPHGIRGYTGTRPTLGPYYAGWYVFATARRYGLEAQFNDPTPFYDEEFPVIKPSPVAVRSTPFGPIPTGTRFSAVIPRAAHIHNHRVMVARVHCATRCKVSYDSESYGNADDFVQYGARRFKGTLILRAPAYSLLKRTRVITHVWIDNGLAALGKSRFSR